MPKMITEAQKREVENLAVEHWDALIAFGADMYRDGLIRGATIGILSATIAVTTSILVREIKKRHKRSKQEEQSLKETIQSFIDTDFNNIDFRIHK